MIREQEAAWKRRQYEQPVALALRFRAGEIDRSPLPRRLVRSTQI